MQEVSLIETASGQVEYIVDSISQVIGVDVCSLYQLNNKKEMVLLATHGLDSSLPLIIPPGKGLVGLVTRSRHPINIENAAEHPDYLFIDNIGEENFKSFCGVPLVNYGKVIGVLVVQRHEAIKLADEHEAFLATLASQLSFLVSHIEVKTVSTRNTAVYINAVAGSPGVGIGQIRLYTRPGLESVPEYFCDNIEDEINQWHELLALTLADIAREQKMLGDEISQSISAIFDAYKMLLNDQSLSQKVEQEIRAGFCMMTALRNSIHYFSELFKKIDDPYLRSRHEDMSHLGNKLYEVRQKNKKDYQEPELTINSPVIIVGNQISASDICSVPVEQLAGIVSYEGSALSHSAILANALGIPAVMGTGELKGVIADERIIIDGNIGKVIIRPAESVVNEYQLLKTRALNFGHQLEQLRDLPAVTKDNTRIKLLTNTGLQADLMPGLKNGAEGVGLYRTEIPFMVRDSFPTEEEQIEDYHKVFEAYGDKPVYMRTLDIGGDKQLPYFPISGEENPALGWRGIRFTLDNSQLMMTQVRAMIRSTQGADTLHILLPMVSSTNELNDFISLLDDACIQLSEEQYQFKRPKIGVMIEVPAAISQIPFWKDKIDFLSIGSNDMSQYLLALDRNNTRIANRFNLVHPAVIHEINRIVALAKNHQIPLSLCGEMAAHPVSVLLLLGMGIRKLSMSSAKLLRIKSLIRAVTIEQTEQFLNRALSMDKADEIYNEGVLMLIHLGMSELLN